MHRAVRVLDRLSNFISDGSGYVHHRGTEAQRTRRGGTDSPQSPRSAQRESDLSLSFSPRPLCLCASVVNLLRSALLGQLPYGEGNGRGRTPVWGGASRTGLGCGPGVAARSSWIRTAGGCSTTCR